MKSVIKKVNNVSELWEEIDYDTASHHISFGTNDDSSKSLLNEDVASFLYDYIHITLKFGILIPNHIKHFSISNINTEIERILKMREIVDISFCFNQLYFSNNKTICSCLLYTQRSNNTIRLENIVNTHLLQTYDDILGKEDVWGETVKIYFVSNEFHILYASDSLLFSLSNNKTNYCDIDNSDTAYLNTPRYNSFLRDFLNLCTEYGGKIQFFCTESLKEVYSEQGILCKGEIIYYEDIYDLLPEVYKYKLFKEVSLFS